MKANELKIPIKRFGRLGEWMGIALLSEEYRKTDENGIINIPETIKYLKQIMKLLDEVENELNKG